jgi:PAS domain S-box-containing protein
MASTGDRRVRRKSPDAIPELRRRAEERLRPHGPPEGGGGGGGSDAIVHELRVHQIELELQNEELRRARLELERAAARTAELYEFAPVPYVSLDASGTIREVNRAVVALLGQERSHLVARRLGQFVTMDDRAEFNAFVAAALGGAAGAQTCEVRLALEGRPPLPVLLTATALPRSPEVLLAIEDLTARKAAEELRAANLRLLQSERHKDEFLGMLSHELRSPLAPLRNALYLLDRLEPTGAGAQRAKEIANRQVVHLARLVDDLLDVTRIARGKVALQLVRLDVAALARRSADDHRALLEERGLELALPGDPVLVNGDEVRLAQVLGNLLSNAAKFTPAGGRVTLEVEARAPRAVIRVRDTGVGIEPEAMETIFDPFTQAKQTLARSEGGLGLGLALVRGLVALHGGDVGARSLGAGRGADFTVTLPLASPLEP